LSLSLSLSLSIHVVLVFFFSLLSVSLSLSLLCLSVCLSVSLFLHPCCVLSELLQTKLGLFPFSLIFTFLYFCSLCLSSSPPSFSHLTPDLLLFIPLVPFVFPSPLLSSIPSPPLLSSILSRSEEHTSE